MPTDRVYNTRFRFQQRGHHTLHVFTAVFVPAPRSDRRRACIQFIQWLLSHVRSRRAAHRQAGCACRTEVSHRSGSRFTDAPEAEGSGHSDATGYDNAAVTACADGPRSVDASVFIAADEPRRRRTAVASDAQGAWHQNVGRRFHRDRQPGCTARLSYETCAEYSPRPRATRDLSCRLNMRTVRFSSAIPALPFLPRFCPVGTEPSWTFPVR